MLRHGSAVLFSVAFKTTAQHVRTRRCRAASSLLLLYLRHHLRSVVCAARRRLRVNPSDSASRDNFHCWRRSRCITSSFQRPYRPGCYTPSLALLHLFFYNLLLYLFSSTPPPTFSFHLSIQFVPSMASFNSPPLLSGTNGTADVFGDKMLYAQGPR